MSKLPCEVVRDLFPSYIDELTNEVTNHLIEGHLEGCTDCQTVLASMKNPKAEPVDEKNNGEIDFLKKAKHKNRKKLWMAVALTVALVVGLFFIKNYFIGAIVPIEYVACQVEVKDNLLTIKGVIAAEQLSVSDIEIKETEGIVTIAFECVRRGLFNDNNFKETFTADRNISQVWLGNRILWANGESISAVTSAVYQTKHPYVGDMPANGSTAAALGIGVVLGDYKNELQTKEEPYGWHFLLEEELSHSAFPFAERYMRACGYVMLAVIGNLGEVTYEYDYAGVPMVMTVTKEEATTFAGQNIKYVGEDIVALQRLMEKAELTDRAYVMDYSQWNLEEKIGIEVVNLTEDEIFEISLVAYNYEEEVAFTQVMTNADGSLVKNGQMTHFELLPADFNEERWKNEENILFDILVKNEDDVSYECTERITVPFEYGYTYRYRLTGNKDTGYHISQ